ncbi:MAG: flavin reductase [Flavobacteriales bacterium]|nr:flavin reductase [Flavobacteriales bacterium]
MKTFHLKEIAELEKNFRRNLINSITGFKPLHLLATQNREGNPNLALFSSAVHVGADPPLIGLVFRPLTVPRHSYENIRATGYYSLNHVPISIIQQAHQCSAPYPANVSEFTVTGLHEEQSLEYPIIYVKESPVKIGLQWVEEYTVQANGTIFMVGKIVEIIMSDEVISKDGYVDLQALQITTVCGLDGYHSTQKEMRLQYAKIDRESEKISWNYGT